MVLILDSLAKCLRKLLGVVDCFTMNSICSSNYHSSRKNPVRTSPLIVLMIHVCHLAHIFI